MDFDMIVKLKNAENYKIICKFICLFNFPATYAYE